MEEKKNSIDTRMNRLLEDVTILFTPDEETLPFEERRKYMLQFLDCVVYCATEGKKKYNDNVEQCDHDVVDLEHLYVFKKNEEEGGRSFEDSVRNVPDKWLSMNSKQLSEELNQTLVRRRGQKDLLMMYDTLVQKLGAAKNVLYHMNSRVYTVGKTLLNKTNGQANRPYNNTQNYQQISVERENDPDQMN